MAPGALTGLCISSKRKQVFIYNSASVYKGGRIVWKWVGMVS
jgi:hypothetical protein